MGKIVTLRKQQWERQTHSPMKIKRWNKWGGKPALYPRTPSERSIFSYPPPEKKTASGRESPIVKEGNAESKKTRKKLREQVTIQTRIKNNAFKSFINKLHPRWIAMTLRKLQKLTKRILIPRSIATRPFPHWYFYRNWGKKCFRKTSEMNVIRLSQLRQKFCLAKATGWGGCCARSLFSFFLRPESNKMI